MTLPYKETKIGESMFVGEFDQDTDFGEFTKKNKKYSMKSYKEFLLENKTEKSKFIIDKFNSYAKEDNFSNTEYLYRTYNKIYDKDVLVLARNIYLSNTLSIKERRKIDYYLYLTGQRFEDAFDDYYSNGEMVLENLLSKAADWINRGALKVSKFGDDVKIGFEKLIKGVKTVLELGEKIYNQFLEGFAGSLGKLEEYSNNTFNIPASDDKMAQFSDAMIEYIKLESDKLPDYFERLIKGAESLAILFTNLSKKIALKLKEYFTNFFSKEKITDSYSYESFISYQMNEGIKLTGNFFDNITEFIKTTRPFSWLIELGQYLENLTGKIILKIKNKIVEFIRDISDVDMAKSAGFTKKNESSYNDDFLFEGFSSKFATSASRPLEFAIDMMQIYSMIYIKGINKNADEWGDLAKNIITGNLLGVAEEGFKKITQGALTVGKTAFSAVFPWVMPVVKGISLFFTLYGLWKKIKPMIIAAKEKIKAKLSKTGTTVPSSGATASTPGATASPPSN